MRDALDFDSLGRRDISQIFVELPIDHSDVVRHPRHRVKDSALSDSRSSGDNHGRRTARPESIPHLDRGVDLQQLKLKSARPSLSF